MSSRVKRIGFALLAAVFIAVSLLGCSQTPAVSSAAPSSSVPASSAETQSEESTPKYSFPWTGETKELTYFYADFRYTGRTYDSLIDQEFQKAIGNIKITDLSVGWSDFSTKRNLLLTSGEIPDIISGLNNNQLIEYGGSGQLLDYSKYLDLMPNYSALANKYPSTFWKIGDGIFQLCQTFDSDTVSQEWLANKYYLDKGLTIPTTFDELYEQLKKAKEINPDSYPLFGYEAWGSYSQYLFRSFNTSNTIYLNQETKKWEYGPVGENFKNYIEFMQRCYADKLIPQEFGTMADDVFWTNLSTPNKWFIYIGFTEINSGIIDGIREQDPSFDLENFIPPVATNNTHPWINATGMEGAADTAIAFNAKTADPEFLAAFVDYLMSEPIQTLVNWGIEGQTFNVVNGIKQYAEDLSYPGSLNKGSVKAIEDLGLYAHPIIKQYGPATRNDYRAMDLFGLDPVVLARRQTYKDYLAKNPDYIVRPVPAPSFTAEESAQIAESMNDLNTYVNENYQLFIMGQRAMSDWDKFIADLTKYGDYTSIVELYNSKPLPVLVN